MSSGEDTVCVTVGVLALQGAFHEHMARFASLNASAKGFCVRPIAVRRVDQLEQCHALVIPGGESTAIALGLRNAGLTEPVREWIRRGRPVWGTCAGMIMLAAIATGGKRGGQELLGGMDIQWVVTGLVRRCIRLNATSNAQRSAPSHFLACLFVLQSSSVFCRCPHPHPRLPVTMLKIPLRLYSQTLLLRHSRQRLSSLTMCQCLAALPTCIRLSTRSSLLRGFLPRSPSWVNRLPKMNVRLRA